MGLQVLSRAGYSPADLSGIIKIFLSELGLQPSRSRRAN
jgi:hypothetical protein